MSATGATATPVVQWQVDGEGYLLTPSGAKAARVADGALMLYDKRTREEVPFTMQDWWTVTMVQARGESHEP